MDWKDFFKYTQKKLIIAIIIFIFLPVFPFLALVTDAPSYTFYVSLFAIVISGFKISGIQLSVATILGALIAYFLSSLFIYYWHKISPKTKRGIKENLKVSKGKLIISILGWITVFLAFLIYLSGVYEGIMNFPPFLVSLYDVFTIVGTILAPFTVITLYFLFNVTILFAILFGAFIGLPNVLSGGSIFYPGYLTVYGAIIVFPLLIIEWYILSCVIIYYFKKIKRKIKSRKEC